MSNSLLTPTVIAREGLMQLKNNLVMAMNVHREYKNEFVKIGDSVTIRRPVKFTAVSGATRQNQDAKEGSTSITIGDRWHTSWAFTTQDLTLTIEKYSERYIKPAIIVLANKVDSRLLSLYYTLWMSAGTPGTTPNSFSQLGDLATILDEGAVPDDMMRKLVLSPKARWSMADALKGIYDASMPKELIRKGLLGRLANFDIFGDQNVATHTTGLLNGTPIVDGANQHSNSTPTVLSQTLHIDGPTASQTGWAKAGDVFTIADVYSVNPVSKASTGRLQQFTVLADANSGSGAGDTDLTIAPAIVTSGAYQTVDSVPADDAAITFLGTASTSYPQNLGFHKNALALVTVPLQLPESAGFKARVQSDGYSMRVVKDYDIDNDEEIIRLDIMFGVKSIYPELGGRLWG